MQILFPCSQSTTYMALGFIYVKNLPCLCCQRRVNLQETFCAVFMYRTLAYSEFLRRLSHSCLCLNNVIRNLHCPFFDVIFQDKPPKTLFLQCMQRAVAICGIKTIEKYPVQPSLSLPIT